MTSDIPAVVPPRERTRLKWWPILWNCVIQIGVVLAPFYFSWSAVLVCAVLYCLCAIGITMGFHRLLTHRSFQTPKWVEYLLTVLGSIANQGGPMTSPAA